MTANAHHNRRRIPNRHRLALALLAAMAAPAGMAQTMPSTANLPTEGAVRSGTINTSHTVGGVINPYYNQTTQNTLTITQTTQGGIIDWGTFNIGAGYTVNINNGSGVTLNRVTGFGYGPSPSDILGNLTATGSVFLINPAGIIFNQGAQVNVGNLVASTLDLSDEAFNAGLANGRYVFNAGTAVIPGVENGGTIQVATGGSVALIGSTVTNTGTINAPGGSVVAGSARTVTLDLFGDGLTRIALSGGGLTTPPPSSCDVGCTDAPGQVANRGTITADGGSIILSSSGAAGSVTNLGRLQARAIGTRGGRIVLDAGDGTAMNASLRLSQLDTAFQGVIDAGGGGGRVEMRGATVAMQAFSNTPTPAPAAIIDVSGPAGGSVVLAATDAVYLQANTTAHADASAGAGGSIDISAGNQLFLEGRISATGASGGRITTTTGGTFLISGQVDAGGTAAAGTWTHNAPSINVVSDLLGSMVPSNALLDDAIDQALSDNTNVTLNATAGNIAIQPGVLIFADDATVPLELRMRATGNITGNTFGIGSNASPLSVFMEGAAIDLVDATIETAGGTYAALAGSGGYAITGTSTITTAGGDVTIAGTQNGTGAGAIVGAAIDSGGGAVSITGTSAAGVGVAGTGRIESGGGAITLVGDGATLGVGLGENIIDSGGGAIAVTGTASAANGAGVMLAGSALSGGSGDVTVTGSNPQGEGIRFAPGIRSGSPSRVVTTTGAITLDGTGANYGIDLGSDPGAIQTQSGDISLVGNAVGASAVAGVRLGAGDLTTAGGDILIDGASANGSGVLLGDAGGFSIGSGGGSITIDGSATQAGVDLRGGSVASGGGAIAVTGTASAAGGVGVDLSQTTLDGGTGDVSVTGRSDAGSGVRLVDSRIRTTTGAITLDGTGANYGIDLGSDPGAIQTQSGDISLVGNAVGASAVAGVRLGAGDLTTAGGDILIDGASANGSGVLLGDAGGFSIGSGGGSITIDGSATQAGVDLRGGSVASGGGAIAVTGTASAAGGVGVDLSQTTLDGGTGDVSVTGRSDAGSGVRLVDSGVRTTSGAIVLSGIGAQSGMSLVDGDVLTDSGHIDLRGRSSASGAVGLDTRSTSIRSAGGGVSLAGEAGTGIGAAIGAVDAGAGLVVIRAGNDGGADALVLDGPVASSLGVNLRPGGVDDNGGLSERTSDAILLGGAGDGFALSQAELSRITTPELVIGSPLHAGAITVAGAVARSGNLTLQNQGGAGGIALQAGLDVGGGTLVLASGGTISQTDAGAILAHSLLVQAGGDVLLDAADNNVAADTLAGSAGGTFRYRDVDALSIGTVSGAGIDAAGSALTTLVDSGISAGGDVFVRNLAGDLTLRAGVTGNGIDLVTAGRLQNLGNVALNARDDWRVWANTWEGEARGGLAGSGDLPNLYGCSFEGACVVMVPTQDNHFIYVQQPLATISFDNATREYGLPNPALGFSVTGAILGDTAANVASGTASTTATQGSDVGQYPVTGTFTSRAGYRLQLVPGVFSITPATLLFTANPVVRYLGTANPAFSGDVTGFRNGDTVTSVFGSAVIWSSPAGLLSPIGYYPINGGTSARNYVFAQAPDNATALQIIPLPAQFIPTTTGSSGLGGLHGGRDDLIVYSGGDGGPAGSAVRSAPMCALNAPLGEDGLPASGDPLSREWSKVRSRPNLTNCFDAERKTSCGDF